MNLYCYCGEEATVEASFTYGVTYLCDDCAYEEESDWERDSSFIDVRPVV